MTALSPIHAIRRMMAQHDRCSFCGLLISSIIFIIYQSSIVTATTEFNSTISLSTVPSIKLIKSSDNIINHLDLSEYDYIVEVNGFDLENIDKIRYSFKNNDCLNDDKVVERLTNSSTNINLFGLVKNCCFEVTHIYFCLPHNHGNRELSWIHVVSEIPLNEKKNNRASRQASSDADKSDINIVGVRVEWMADDKQPYFKEKEFYNIPWVLADIPIRLRFFGSGFSEDTLISFTEMALESGKICQHRRDQAYQVKNVESHTATIEAILPLSVNPEQSFYICATKGRLEDANHLSFKHQGTESYKQIETYAKKLQMGLQIFIILVCLSFSALFSGLNLGLMSMDQTELKILCNTGTEQERKYARTIQPVRSHGNYLLCSILFSNVLVNSIFTILLDDLTSGIVAVVCSTLAIVIFGEISPQAFCSRHGLCVGAKTIYITKLTMILTFPMSYPISKILDCLLGEEIGNVYNRERLKELVKVTTGYNDLEKDEVNIIAGALELRKKTVADVMTRIEDVYMLDYNAILDFETVSEIMKSGYSRIPVYEGIRNNIITMLYIKDLAFVDPDDNTPLKTLCQFYQNPCNFVFEDVTLDVMFKQFKEGHKGHMAFVQRVNNEGEGDPFYEVTGLVTLEDVIEELIQAEIMDETDVFTDNRSKRKRLLNRPKMPDFTVFAEKKDHQRIHIAPQLQLAMFQYLSTTVPPFKPDTISETILRRLLKQDIFNHIKVKSRDKTRNDTAAVIYQQGKPVDYFVLILEGRIEVTVGKENLTFESGPFTFFGCQALSVNIGILESPTINANPQTLGSIQSINLDAIQRHTFVPDYSVRAITDVVYVKVKRSLYLAAKRATLLERSQKDPSASNDQYDDEVEKLLHSLDEDDRSAPSSPTLTRKDADLLSNDNQSSPVRSATAPTSPIPVSASPVTNSKFLSPRKESNGQLRLSPSKNLESNYSEVQICRDIDEEIAACKEDAARLLGNKKTSIKEDETVNLLLPQNHS